MCLMITNRMQVYPSACAYLVLLDVAGGIPNRSIIPTRLFLSLGRHVKRIAG